MRYSTILLGKNTVTKTTTPDLMRVEVEKTRSALEIAKACGLFRVPEVFDYDETAGSAVFEKLHDIAPIAKAVPWGEPYSILAKNLGASLAIIHRELRLPDDMTIPLPAVFAFPHDAVYLHGDFSVTNICVGTSYSQIYILDWQMTPLYGGRASYGTRYFDLLWFISNLINHPKISFVFSNPVAPVAKAFMESYFQEAMILYEPDEIAMYATRLFDVEMSRIRQLMRPSWGRSRLLLQCRRALLRLLLPYSRSIMKQFLESQESMS